MITPAGADTLFRRSLSAMGCRFEFLLNPRGSVHDRYSVEAIADELVELVQDWHNRLSVFLPGSMASQINRQPAGQPLALDQDLFELMCLCDSLRTETQGAFNIAAGTLMHAHGFRSGSSALRLDSLDLDHAITLDGSQKTVVRNDDRVTIDFGAIAKGFVLDLLRREISDYGIEHAFVHGGTSSCFAIGHDESQQPWRVRVCQSTKLDACISNFGFGVSEIDARTAESPQGGCVGHIMDIRTMAPTRSTVSRVACAHPSAAIADAYSTALNIRPDLIDTLHEHGCSIAMFELEANNPVPIIRDRLGVFSIHDS